MRRRVPYVLRINTFARANKWVFYVRPSVATVYPTSLVNVKECVRNVRELVDGKIFREELPVIHRP
jgi:hypothetical protein